MLVLRKYQVDIIFLYFSLMFLSWVLFYLIQEYFNTDPHEVEWYINGPLLLYYVVYLWQTRDHIKLADRRRLTSRTLFYWLILGIVLFATNYTPVVVDEYLSSKLFFIVFTVFLADSYWDFKKMTWKNLVDKKEIN